jgi:hypothetical protein
MAGFQYQNSQFRLKGLSVNLNPIAPIDSNCREQIDAPIITQLPSVYHAANTSPEGGVSVRVRTIPIGESSR